MSGGSVSIKSSACSPLSASVDGESDIVVHVGDAHGEIAERARYAQPHAKFIVGDQYAKDFHVMRRKNPRSHALWERMWGTFLPSNGPGKIRRYFASLRRGASGNRVPTRSVGTSNGTDRNVCPPQFTATPNNRSTSLLSCSKRIGFERKASALIHDCCSGSAASKCRPVSLFTDVTRITGMPGSFLRM